MSLFRKILACLLISAVAVTVFAGCGSEQPKKVSNITIDKDGKIVGVIYEDFGQEYYDLDELKTMAASEIDEYNKDSASEKVSLSDMEAIDDNSRVRMTMSYESASDYSHFNQVSLFYGTVKEAQDMGYNVPKTLTSAKGDTLPESFLDENPDRHLVITSEKIDITTPFDVEYMSGGITLNGKKEADLSAVTGETATLLLSK